LGEVNWVVHESQWGVHKHTMGRHINQGLLKIEESRLIQAWEKVLTLTLASHQPSNNLESLIISLSGRPPRVSLGTRNSLRINKIPSEGIY